MMVRPQTALDAVLRTISDESDMPTETDYLNRQADEDGVDANVKLPIVEAQIVDIIDIDDFNTDDSGRTTDDQGNETGIIYRNNYELLTELTVMVSADSSWDASEVGQALRDRLYLHTPEGPNEPLYDASDNAYESIWDFEFAGSERDDRTVTNPTVRQWRQRVRLRSYVERETDIDPIEDVNYPSA